MVDVTRVTCTCRSMSNICVLLSMCANIVAIYFHYAYQDIAFDLHLNRLAAPKCAVRLIEVLINSFKLCPWFQVWTTFLENILVTYEHSHVLVESQYEQLSWRCVSNPRWCNTLWASYILFVVFSTKSFIFPPLCWVASNVSWKSVASFVVCAHVKITPATLLFILLVCILSILLIRLSMTHTLLRKDCTVGASSKHTHTHLMPGQSQSHTVNLCLSLSLSLFSVSLTITLDLCLGRNVNILSAKGWRGERERENQLVIIVNILMFPFIVY